MAGEQKDQEQVEGNPTTHPMTKTEPADLPCDVWTLLGKVTSPSSLVAEEIYPEKTRQM